MSNKNVSKQTDNFSYQNVTFGSEAQKEMLKGAKILCDAVRTTMGPSGQNVIIDFETASPVITKDGVTVARSINLKEKLPSVGAELLKEIASKTNDLAGDGTSTGTVLGYEMFARGIKMISTGRSAIEMKQGMEIAKNITIDFLKNGCIPIEKDEDIINIGTISANGDREIGELLSLAISKVGKDGIITVEPAKSIKTTLEITEGMQLGNGYLSPYFVSNGEKLSWEANEPYVLLTTQKISSINDILGILEAVQKTAKPLLIICDEMDAEPLHTCIVNKTKGVINICIVKAPSYGEHRVDILNDISLITGGEVIGSSSDVSLKHVKLSHLGICKKIIVGRTFTTLIGAKSEERQSAVNKRVSDLRTVLETDKTLDELHINRYKERLAKLGGGIAVIKVGGNTEVEILEKKDRVDDALNATIAAIQEGIVPGGGIALFYAARYLKFLRTQQAFADLTEDQMAGIEVILETCLQPFNTIISNTGKSPEVVSDKLLSAQETIKMFDVFRKKELEDTRGNKFTWDNPFIKNQYFKQALGYNASSHTYENLIMTGVIDPVKVTRLALEHATSVVSLMLTCNCVITNEE